MKECGENRLSIMAKHIERKGLGIQTTGTERLCWEGNMKERRDWKMGQTNNVTTECVKCRGFEC